MIMVTKILNTIVMMIIMIIMIVMMIMVTEILNTIVMMIIMTKMMIKIMMMIMKTTGLGNTYIVLYQLCLPSSRF